jgi:hypothetical protein
MTDVQRKGCLTAILGIFGFKLGGPSRETALPYRQRDDFLSAAELAFYRVLANTLRGRATICPKVNLADIFFVARPNENQHYRNKIDRKHVDFLICDPATMKPLCGIELDDSSHRRPDRQHRDEFVDQVFKVAGLALVRITAQHRYSREDLLSRVEPYLAEGPAHRPPQPLVASSGEPPVCPKCGVQMVKRVATKGPNAGQPFFGCPNYPRCKEVVRVASG